MASHTPITIHPNLKGPLTQNVAAWKLLMLIWLPKLTQVVLDLQQFVQCAYKVTTALKKVTSACFHSYERCSISTLLLIHVSQNNRTTQLEGTLEIIQPDPLLKTGKPFEDVTMAASHQTGRNNVVVKTEKDFSQKAFAVVHGKQNKRISELGGTLEAGFPYTISDKWLSNLFLKTSSVGAFMTSGGKEGRKVGKREKGGRELEGRRKEGERKENREGEGRKNGGRREKKRGSRRKEGRRGREKIPIPKRSARGVHKCSTMPSVPVLLKENREGRKEGKKEGRKEKGGREWEGGRKEGRKEGRGKKGEQGRGRKGKEGKKEGRREKNGGRREKKSARNINPSVLHHPEEASWKRSEMSSKEEKQTNKKAPVAS
ncbi:Histone-lysine N-methyltransferase, H3 lysine-79 specific, partial [Ophiophagus hannah]